ncbi:response regulator [Luteolibacter pohnpeiensis]|nr:response regulator [Luteolibacter pohnpeiensis]
MFACLLFVEWLACIAMVIWLTPLTWLGGVSKINPHVWAAVILGGLVTLPPILLIWKQPGKVLNRHIIAFAQMISSALMIHLSGGRIEFHFHIFGSLAFLSFYRDWRVLVTASLVVLVDHYFRGVYWPMSVFGTMLSSSWRWLEHGGWVVFEDIFLIYACLYGQKEMKEVCHRRAQLEIHQGEVERRVELRTRELATANAALEEQVQHRILIERELVAAKEAAEAGSMAKSEFLANMSHEIRTPMNGVLGMTSLLLDTPLDEQQRGFTETIRDSADSLLTIINDILDFSKIEAGRIDLEVIPVCLRSTVEDAIDLLSKQAEEKGLDLIYYIDEAAPEWFLGDVTRLRQVLVNLISNAIKFTHKGEVLVEVESVKIDPPEGSSPNQTWHQLEFRVIDTGIGIPKDRMNRLFQLFSQVDASTTRRYGGTGLGLAICRQLTELMGGTIGVDSEDGKGSNFHFTIQIPETEAGLDDAAELLDPTPFQGHTILVVDDNATNRRIFSIQIERWGMVSIEAESAGEAIELLAGETRIDLAILDMQMPEIDGLQLAEQIRNLTNRAGLPLIMFSSAGLAPGRGDKRWQWFDSYLPKPVKQSQLHHALARALGLAKDKPTRKSQSPLISQSLADLIPLRILLAEDNLVNQRVARMILGRMGYEADVVSDGNEALTAARLRHYDLILMDIQMPGMDGLEATRILKSEFPSAAQCPQIIALTAHASESDRKECLAAGMDDYLSKPIRTNILEQKIRQAAARREGTTGVA